MKLYVVTKTTESGQCYFDFENQFWVPLPMNGKRGLTTNESQATTIADAFKHQDGKVHCFMIEVPQPTKPVVHDSCFIPGVH